MSRKKEESGKTLIVRNFIRLDGADEREVAALVSKMKADLAESAELNLKISGFGKNDPACIFEVESTTDGANTLVETCASVAQVVVLDGEYELALREAERMMHSLCGTVAASCNRAVNMCSLHAYIVDPTPVRHWAAGSGEKRA